MEFGTVAPTFPPIENLIKVAKRLEEKGYSALWFPDHLMGWYPNDLWLETEFSKRYPSCHMFYDAFCSICYVANSTKLKLGVSVTEILRRHPVVLLQQAVTANHATKGRFILGIGAGEAENVVPYGIDFDKPVAKLEEALKLIRIILNTDCGEVINFEGKFYKLKNAAFDLKPIGQIPIWIGAHGDRMLRITAKYGDGWLPVNILPEVYKELIKRLEKYARDEKRDIDEITKAVFVSLVIDERREEVEKLLKTPILKCHALLIPSYIYERYGLRHPLGNFRGLVDYIPTEFDKEKILKLINSIPDKAVKLAFVSGTPEDIVDTFDKYEKIGVEHIVIWNVTYFGDFSKVRISYDLIDEVIKHF